MTKGRTVIRAWEESVGKVLSSRSLRLTVESPETLTRDSSYETPVTTLGALEGLARESFVEDDYEGAMHALTLRREDMRLVGVLFWRDLHPDEMAEWLASTDRLLPASPPALPSTPRREEEEEEEEEEDVFGGVLVTRAGRVEFAQGAESAVPTEWGSSSPLEGWVKIEIMGTREGEGGQGYGRLLLTTALFLAVARDGNSHAVLQVAGGDSNSAAMHLYSSMGFVPAPPGIFNAPNESLMILRDIPSALLQFILPASLQRNHKALRQLSHARDHGGDDVAGGGTSGGGGVGDGAGDGTSGSDGTGGGTGGGTSGSDGTGGGTR